MASKANEEPKIEISKENLEKSKWMVRSCETYDDEYSECTSVKARFHQYFIFGEPKDCNSWKVDHTNCLRWRNDKDLKALKEIIDSETKRRHERLFPHYQNDTWKKRTGPPPEWNKPLPAWLEEENKATFLAVKAEEIRSNGKIEENGRTFCVIS